MLSALFQQLAAYNKWANATLYAAAATLPDIAYGKDVGLFFGSVHATLNHLLVTDRLWLWRLTRTGEMPKRLDETLFDNLPDLAHARAAEDDRLAELIASYGERDLDRMHGYPMINGTPQEQRIADILQHLFNHQTHHRGQAHAGLSILAHGPTPSLDLLLFQRGMMAPAMPYVENSTIT